MLRELKTSFRFTKGYRTRPWNSPYLKWRIETWSGIEAETITPRQFVDFCRQHRGDLMRYLKWVADNSPRER